MWLKCSLCSKNCFFSLLPAIFFELPITRTFFDFPWRFGLSGVDCSTKLKKLVNGKRISIRNVPIGKMGLPFQNFRLSREFSVAQTKKSFTIYIPTGIYGNPIGQLCLSGPSYSSPTVINFSRYLIFFLLNKCTFYVHDLSNSSYWQYFVSLA